MSQKALLMSLRAFSESYERDVSGSVFSKSMATPLYWEGWREWSSEKEWSGDWPWLGETRRPQAGVSRRGSGKRQGHDLGLSSQLSPSIASMEGKSSRESKSNTPAILSSVLKKSNSSRSSRKGPCASVMLWRLCNSPEVVEEDGETLPQLEALLEMDSLR